MTRMSSRTHDYPAAVARFPRKALAACLPAATLVAAVAVMMGELRWAGLYWLASAWALVFFILTPLVFKSMLVDRNRLAGLGWLAAKLGWLAVMAFGCWRLNLAPEAGRMLGSALLAGTLTTLVVMAGVAIAAASAARGLPMIRPKGDAS